MPSEPAETVRVYRIKSLIRPKEQTERRQSTDNRLTPDSAA